MSQKPKTRRKIWPEKSWGPRTRRAKWHFTTDGYRRYCSNRQKGKDELTEDWSKVDCYACLIKGEPRPRLSPEMERKIREFLEKRKSGRRSEGDS